MAKAKRKNGTRRRMGKNPLSHSRRRRRNPDFIGMNTGSLGGLSLGAVLGLLINVYGPAKLLAAVNQPDAGMMSYLIAGLFDVVPAWLLKKFGFPNAATGFFAAATAAIVWRGIDDASNQQIVPMGAGMGSFLFPANVALPGRNEFGQFARNGQRMLPAMTASTVSAPVSKSGVGYVKFPYAA